MAKVVVPILYLGIPQCSPFNLLPFKKFAQVGVKNSKHIFQETHFSMSVQKSVQKSVRIFVFVPLSV